MTLAPDLLGTQSEPVRFSWTAEDVMLYALAVGTGQEDPTSGLAYTTENTHGVTPAVLPTYANIITRGARITLGFAGPRGESTPCPIPQRDPDETVTVHTRPEQALLYRLTGDRNPLHSDPGFAARGGFDRPILHGMCTYGFTGRVLLRTVCDGDPRTVRGHGSPLHHTGNAGR